MPVNWSAIIQRMATKNADGKFMPVYVGTETDDHLRNLIIHLVEYGCDPGDVGDCTFGPLKRLLHYSLRDVVGGFSRETCLAMLDEECAHRNGAGCQNCRAV